MCRSPASGRARIWRVWLLPSPTLVFPGAFRGTDVSKAACATDAPKCFGLLLGLSVGINGKRKTVNMPKKQATSPIFTTIRVPTCLATYLCVQHHIATGVTTSRAMAVAIQQPTVRVSLFWLWLAGGLFVASAAASQGDDQNHGVVFIYPTAGQIYHVNDTINVTYTSPFPTPNLYGFCDGGGRQGEISTSMTRLVA